MSHPLPEAVNLSDLDVPLVTPGDVGPAGTRVSDDPDHGLDLAGPGSHSRIHRDVEVLSREISKVNIRKAHCGPAKK